MNQPNLRNTEFRRSIINLQERAERNASERALQDIYVDFGLLERLLINKNQIILGRRGTGKTHLLKAFSEKQFMDSPYRTRSFYLDLKHLDSGTDSHVLSTEDQAHILFGRLLGEIEKYLLDQSVRLERGHIDTEDGLTQCLHALSQSINNFIAKKNSEREAIPLNRQVELILDQLQCDYLYIVLDEWVSINEDVQPFFAEKINRVFFGSARICFKIASIDHRQKMSETVKGRNIGFERGAEITAVIDLDDFLVYEQDEAHIANVFSEVLFNHLFVNSTNATKEEKAKLILEIFTEKETFYELVRAGEGVVRDFLQVFYYSYLNYFLPDREKLRIGIDDIRRAARDYYEKEKMAAVKGNTNLYNFLMEIVTTVIREKKSRHFMVSQQYSNSSILQELFDVRVIHRFQRGWSNKDDPGKRFDVYKIDFGTYVELHRTKQKLNDLFDVETSADVPKDDRRSIRQIVLPDEMLERYSALASSQ